MKKIVLVLVLVALVAGGVKLVKKRKEAMVKTPLPAPVTYRVRTVHPESRTVEQADTFLAQLESRRSIGIASKLSGRISQLSVREKQAVHKGDLLVRLDDREIQASIAGLTATLGSARSQRDYAQKQLDRNRDLFEAGGLAREKLEASEVAWATAVATVEDLAQKIQGLENQLSYSRITAPFDAVVGTVFLHQGDLATPGRPILRLNSLPQKLTFSFVPGPDKVQAGQDVLSGGQKIGTVSLVYDDARNGLWVAEVALDRRLGQPAGSYLTIDVVTRRGSGCSVPVRALLHRPDGESVMLHEKGRFQERAVTVLARDARYALIEPCVEGAVAVASEAKLSLLPTSGVQVLAGETNE
ncbi:efflux RND transporter periplasmic adaptor subunit [Desulfolithobacter sp.]